MFQLMRKNLTPDQMKRANITTSITVTIAYVFFTVIILAAPERTTVEKVCFTLFYMILYGITAFNTYRHITEKRAELCIAIGFCIGFGAIAYVQEPSVMMLVFPVMMSLCVYLNEYLLVWGTGATLVFVITKVIRIYVENPADKQTQVDTVFMVVISLIICLFGCCKAVKRLIEFSTEETDAVAQKAEEQRKVSKEVEKIAGGIHTQFTLVQRDLTEIVKTIDNTQTVMEAISDGADNCAEQTQTQSEKTNEIQDRLSNTNDAAEMVLKTTEKLQSVVENGKSESDELARQSVIVDESTEQISKTIEKLVEHVKKVSGITDAILNISSQTNLLALNASIEAARAGEAGKGFAVVADEIRQLAEMTKVSTEQITQIMNELTEITNDTQDELKSAVDSIDVQRDKVKTVHESFNEVEENIASLVSNMTTVSEEVSAVMNANGVIVDGISTLSGVSEEIAASTTEGKNDMLSLHDKIASFTGAVDDTFTALEELQETAVVKEDVETE